MSLLSLVFALLLEQWQPLSGRKLLYSWLTAYVDLFHQGLDGGKLKHGQIAWFVAILLPVFISIALYWMLAAQSSLAAWIFSVLVLYLTMGFRQFSHHFTDINKALQEGDLIRARELLSAWRGEPCDSLSAEEIVRLTLEDALLCTHRNVFGVMFWFVFTMFLGMGPVGAIIYRMSQYMSIRWRKLETEGAGQFSDFAILMYRLIEWLPVRMTAFSFAIAGNFEDAIYCWRTQSRNWVDPEAGIVLASGAGALGVRLGMPIANLEPSVDRPELGVGEEAESDFMQSAIGLAWRALVFWLIILLLLTLASMTTWVGL